MHRILSLRRTNENFVQNQIASLKTEELLLAYSKKLHSNFEALIVKQISLSDGASYIRQLSDRENMAWFNVLPVLTIESALNEQVL